MRGIANNLSIGSLVVFPKTTTYPKKKMEKKKKKEKKALVNEGVRRVRRIENLNMSSSN
jgi:hypothetical protein